MPSKIYIILSMLIHAAVGVVWYLGVPFADREMPTSRPAVTKPPFITSEIVLDLGKQKTGSHVVTEGANVPASSQQSVPSRLPEAAKQPLSTSPEGQPHAVSTSADQERRLARIKYAGSPASQQAAESTTQSNRDREADGQAGTYEVSTPKTAPQPTVAANGVQIDGYQAPAFSVNLTNDDLKRILATGQGCIIIFCEEDRYLFDGTAREPRRITSASDGRLTAFSERALLVPAAFCQRISEQLQRSFDLSANRVRQCRFHLLLTNELDQLILQRQQAAATSLSRQLEDVGTTVGRFEYAGQHITEFHISSAILKDGRRLQVEQSSSDVGAPRQNRREPVAQ